MFRLNNNSSFTLLSPSFYYNDNNIRLKTDKSTWESAIIYFWDALKTIFDPNALKIDIYNFPLLIKNNISLEVKFIFVQQQIDEDDDNKILKLNYTLDKKIKISELLFNGAGNKKKHKLNKIKTVNINSAFNDNNYIFIDNFNVINEKEISKLSSLFFIHPDTNIISLPKLKCNLVHYYYMNDL